MVGVTRQKIKKREDIFPVQNSFLPHTEKKLYLLSRVQKQRQIPPNPAKASLAADLASYFSICFARRSRKFLFCETEGERKKEKAKYIQISKTTFRRHTHFKTNGCKIKKTNFSRRKREATCSPWSVF